MTNLYSTHARVYHDMYQQIFDYDREFEIYDSKLRSAHCKKILEIACGTGILGQHFIKGGYDYLGLDLYQEMIDIAKEESGSDRFIQGDMRNLTLNQSFDAILITGHSLAYVINNHELIDTFRGINKILTNSGLLIFGVFKAESIFSNLKDFEQSINHGAKKIRRISKFQMNLKEGWTYDWSAKYIIEEDGKRDEYEDLTTLRAFTKDEIALFLSLSGLEIVEVINEERAFSIICKKSFLE